MNNKTVIVLFFCLCSVVTLHAERVDMRRAGAKPDGKTLNTKLINATIEKLHKAGGGTLFFPSGTYLTGAIRLQSHITLDLEAGATLLFSDHFDHYLPFVDMRYEGVMMKSFSPLIYAVDCENITIKGEGTLDGQGKAWWTEFFRILVDLKDNGMRNLNTYQTLWDEANDTKALYADTNEDYTGTLQRRFFRPPFIQPVRCKNVRIEGVKIVNSPFWTVNPEFCDNVIVKGVTIHNPPSPNTDGINPESCRNVHISDCHISVGDDCITIKSGRDLQGRRMAVPCENITITNCTMLSGHGGVVIGSEMSGSVRKVTISNCVFDGTDRGIRLKSTRGRGGVVEAIRVSNIVMSNIKKEAIILDLRYSNMPQEEVSDRTPVFRNIHISGLTGVNVNIPIFIRGLEEAPITDITLRDINIESEQKPTFEYCERVKLTDVIVNGKEVSAHVSPLNDKQAWESRSACLRKEVRQRLGIDTILNQRVSGKPILSKVRKFDGYTVQNIALETLPGLYVCGSIYTPATKGKHALIICPNGHFSDGRYRKDQQQRMATLARMGAVCVDYDLYGWGESALQVGSASHRSSVAHVMQAVNGISLLDYMLNARKDIDATRIGANGGSGGGTQVVLLTTLDNRFTAAAPVVSLASHFDGGCPCESGMPVTQACGGTNNAELMAMFAPRPLLVVSDGKDWTSSVPTLEYPYLQRIYSFYNAVDKVSNVHLPTEGHDFGPNKRNAVYDFFAASFALDKKMEDESKVTIEPQTALLSFGVNGELLPEGAVRSF